MLGLRRSTNLNRNPASGQAPGNPKKGCKAIKLQHHWILWAEPRGWILIFKLRPRTGYRRKEGVAPIENTSFSALWDVRGRSYRALKVQKSAFSGGFSSAPGAPTDPRPSFGGLSRAHLRHTGSTARWRSGDRPRSRFLAFLHIWAMHWKGADLSQLGAAWAFWKCMSFAQVLKCHKASPLCLGWPFGGPVDTLGEFPLKIPPDHSKTHCDK